MIMQRFIDRIEEREELEKSIYEDPLIILYGRRRVGKTRLLIETIKEYRSLYLLCMEEEVNETLGRLNQKLMNLDDGPLVQRPLDSFEEFFELISDEDIVIVFDEFPLLADNHPKILGLLQEFYDFQREGDSTIILCGSSITMMDDIKSYESPIYGRRSKTLKIELLGFDDIREFFPQYSLEDQVFTYAVLDGVPEYLLRFDDDLDFYKNVYENLLRKTFLYEEAEYLLRYELRNLSTYNTILESIAFGYSSFSDLRNKTGIDSSKLSKYLNTLRNLGIVKKELPITLSKKEKIKRKNAVYRIDDNYFRFYYSFIYPFKEEIDIRILDRPKEELDRKFNRYVGFVFEKIAKEYLISLNRKGELPFKFNRIGRWWDKAEEIDLIGLDEKEKKALFVEIKWSTLEEIDVSRIHENLKRKAEKAIEGGDKHYLVIGKDIEYEGSEISALSLDDLVGM